VADELILGIWDGHDSGAALVQGDKIIVAINEERLTRRKLEIKFPHLSIKACLEVAGKSPADVAVVACSTTDFAKTLTRVLPNLKEEYYKIRRKKIYPGPLSAFKKRIKYRLTEWPPSAVTAAISRRCIESELNKAGLGHAKLELVNHHTAHAASAVVCSGYDQCLGLSIDGIGDGLSGSIWTFGPNGFNRISAIDGRTSFGIFFEHVTNLLNMRELEDEGKVMALSNFAYPIPDSDNPMLSLLTIDGLKVRVGCSSTRLYDELKRILWRFPAEQFAYMAQRVLEVRLLELVKNAIAETGLTRIAYSGGVASNVKVNMLIRELPEVEGLYVFPHMGDGGLAIGAAVASNLDRNGVTHSRLDSALLGPSFSGEQIDQAIDAAGLRSGHDVRVVTNPAEETAKLLAAGEILMWFQSRMEIGPRALGGRSILARPDSPGIKDTLNLKLKRRVWYQPFCPSMLKEDALELLEGYDGRPEPFMTGAYRTKPEKRAQVAAVTNVDGSCRPQILSRDSDNPFAALLSEFKKITGLGVILNTSFNLHGEPVVCTPADALRTFRETGIRTIVLGDRIVTKRAAE
jgi:carbamoyltransferase